MTPTELFKALADETRVRITQQIVREGELCVCELTAALEQSQPKISRHLRAGQWIYYRLHPQLPAWAAEILTQVLNADGPQLAEDQLRLHSMRDRPDRASLCG